MAYSANGYNFPSKKISRVKYDLLIDVPVDTLSLDAAPDPEYIPDPEEIP